MDVLLLFHELIKKKRNSQQCNKTRPKRQYRMNVYYYRVGWSAVQPDQKKQRSWIVMAITELDSARQSTARVYMQVQTKA